MSKTSYFLFLETLKSHMHYLTKSVPYKDLLWTQIPIFFLFQVIWWFFTKKNWEIENSAVLLQESYTDQ